MTFYVHVPLSKDGIAETKGPIERVEMRAFATEMIYRDAAYLQNIATEKWWDIAWKIEHVSTSKFVVRGESKSRKPS